jgi:2,3,4,5-tetrahydropyridine-2-carboxylate N-succinyltransferase
MKSTRLESYRKQRRIVIKILITARVSLLSIGLPAAPLVPESQLYSDQRLEQETENQAPELNPQGKDRIQSMIDLKNRIEHFFTASDADPSAAMAAFEELRDALEAGAIRSAEPDASAPTGWRVNTWVKQGILLGFRLGHLAVAGGDLPCVDKHTYPIRRFTPDQGIRIVTGGSSVRAGAYLAKGVICVPPMYVNTGSYVDEGTLVDSHALVGSCAQIGKRVHLSAAAQIGGVLEPVNASPVILEDDVLVGGNCGVYEGTIVRKKAVLAAGTVLTRGTPVYDVVRGEVLRAEGDMPLIIPEGAVVVPGARAVSKGKAQEWGLSVYTPVIVKYRDEKTELSLALEDLLR